MVEIFDEKLSLKPSDEKNQGKFIVPLKLLLLYKCNKMIENCNSILYLEIPQTTLKYYLSKNFASSENSIKFYSISGNSKQKFIFDFKGNNDKLIHNGTNAQMSFEVKKFSQAIIIQFLNLDKTINDSETIKISNLSYFLEGENPHEFTLLFNHKPFVILLYLKKETNEKAIRSIADMKELENNKAAEKKAQSENTKNNLENQEKKKKISDLDQIKLKIHNFKKENANLSTQLLREQKLVIQQKKTIEEIEFIINGSDTTNNSLNASKKAKPKAMDQNKINKARELFNSICVCGAPNPKFRGYCGECLKKMKEEYEKILNDYLPLNEKLENLSQKNINHMTKYYLI